MRNRVRTFLVGAAALAAGCGYRLAAAPRLPEGARSVYVPVFRNLTSEPGVETSFTDALRQELARAGLEGGEASDLVARGEILEVTPSPGVVVSVSGTQQVQSVALYRVAARAVVRLEKGGRVVAEAHVSGAEEYTPGRDASRSSSAELPYKSEANKRLALRRLAATLMRDAVEQIAASDF